MIQPYIETLRLVGGRRTDGAHPNIGIIPSPSRRARGREERTFLLLLDLGEETPSHLYREIREVTAQAFWSSTSSVTAALRRAVIAANRALFQANLESQSQDRCYGGLTCVAVLEEEVFIAQAGPSWACALCEGQLQQFPEEELPHLGSAAYVDVRLTYLSLRPGDTLVLGTRQLGRSLSDDALRRVLPREDRAALTDGLEQLGAGESFSALVVRWTEEMETIEPSPPPPEERVPPPDEEPQAREKERRPTPRRRFALPTVRLPSIPVRRGLRWLKAGVSRAAAGIAGAFQTLFRRMLPGRERMAQTRKRKERQPPPEDPRLMAGVALGVLLVVILVTLITWLNYDSRLRHNRSLENARESAAQAQEATDPEAARGHWQAVLAELEGITDNPEAEDLVGQAQTALDELNRVTWVEPTLLWDFGPEIDVRRLVVHSQWLFVLDTATGSVFQLTLAESGEKLVETDTAPILIEGGSGEEQLVDMAWAGPGGERTADALVALETGGALEIYDPAWGLNRVYLGSLPDQAAPVAVSTFHGRLYLLDPQSDQVWRYLPEDGGYPNRPEPYFPVGPPHPLDAARDLAIDGNVYILFEDSSVEKYFEGELVSFDLGSVPGSAPSFTALAVNAQLTNGPVYLADAANERIVITAADGTFERQWRARDGAFQSLAALSVDEATSRLFILAGGRLYTLAVN